LLYASPYDSPNSFAWFAKSRAAPKYST
jgi:hypothetical protein